MTMLQPNRRAFLVGAAALSAASLLSARVARGQTPPSPVSKPAPTTPGRLTFHGIDTFNGATIGTLRVDIALAEGGTYRLVKTFDTATNGRSDGALFEGDTFKPGRYELTMHVGAYYAALGARLPSPAFLDTVPLRFGVADASERYHIAVLFGPWSYSYYRGS